MRLVQSAARGLRAAVQGGYGGGRGMIGRGRSLLGGIDMNAEAGRRVDNSIVYTAISRSTLPMLEADLFVARPNADGKLVRVRDHPIERLLRQPVPWMGDDALRSLWHMARILAGNAYCLKHRSPAGRLVGLEYLPLSTCVPISRPGSGNFVDAYMLALAAGAYPEKPANVLHLRWHTVDPWAPAIGIGPLEACLPEIASDNRAARYEAAVLRNGGKAHILTPRGQDKNGNPVTFDKPQRQQFSDLMSESASEDAAGSMVVLPYPMEATEIGWKPADLMLGSLRDLSEERVAACIGAPLSWLGLGSGLASDSNKATRETVDVQALFGFVFPQYKVLCKQLTEDLVPELGEPGDVVTFDRKQIAAYLRYLIDLAIAGSQATGGPTMTVNEWRTKVMDEDAIDGGDVLRQSPDGPAAPSDPMPDDPGDEKL